MTELVLISIALGAVGVAAGRELPFVPAMAVAGAAFALHPFVGGMPLLAAAVACAATVASCALTNGGGARATEASARQIADYRRLVGEAPAMSAPAVGKPTEVGVGSGVFPGDEASGCGLLLRAEIAVNRLPKGSPSETLAMDALIDSFNATTDDERAAALNQAIMIANRAVQSAA